MQPQFGGVVTFMCMTSYKKLNENLSSNVDLRMAHLKTPVLSLNNISSPISSDKNAAVYGWLLQTVD